MFVCVCVCVFVCMQVKYVCNDIPPCHQHAQSMTHSHLLKQAMPTQSPMQKRYHILDWPEHYLTPQELSHYALLMQCVPELCSVPCVSHRCPPTPSHVESALLPTSAHTQESKALLTLHIHYVRPTQSTESVCVCVRVWHLLVAGAHVHTHF